MDNVKKYALGILVGAAVLLALYFFWHKPEVNKAKNEGFRDGFRACADSVQQEYIPAKPDTVYKDTTIYKEVPVRVEGKDSSITLTSVIDSSATFGKNRVEVKDSVSVNVKKKNGKWQFEDLFASHKLKIEHRGIEQPPDTLRIYVPKLIEKVVETNNWLYTLIAYISGLATAALLFLL